MRHSWLFISLCVAIVVGGAQTVGCQSKAGTGSLAGAGVGALVGQLAGGNTASTLIGAGIGTGVGYLIGNEADKADARKRSQATEAELQPLAGTAWQLISARGTIERPAKSLVARFNRDGTLTTTRTFDDGTIDNATENYRVVGDTLIVNRPNYVVNAKFRINGNQMILDAGDRSAVLQRI